MGDLSVRPDQPAPKAYASQAIENIVYPLDFSMLGSSGHMSLDPITSDPFGGLDSLNPSAFGSSDQINLPNPLLLPTSLVLSNPSTQPNPFVLSNPPPVDDVNAAQPMNLTSPDWAMQAVSNALGLTVNLEDFMLSVDNMQTKGWPLNSTTREVPLGDIDDQLRLIELERREIELRTWKKQLQAQAGRGISQTLLALRLPPSLDMQPWEPGALDTIQTESDGTMNQVALSSANNTGRCTLHAFQHEIPLPDSEMTCLPPDWLSLESKNIVPVSPSNERGTLSTIPILEKVVDISEMALAESGSDALRASPISLQDNSAKMQERHSSMTLVERTRRKKKPEVPGSLCFQLNGVSGLVKTKRVQTKEAVKRTRAMKKVGACLYCRYLKKPVRHLPSHIQLPLVLRIVLITRQCSSGTPCERCIKDSIILDRLGLWSACSRPRLSDMVIFNDGKHTAPTIMEQVINRTLDSIIEILRRKKAPANFIIGQDTLENAQSWDYQSITGRNGWYQLPPVDDLSTLCPDICTYAIPNSFNLVKFAKEFGTRVADLDKSLQRSRLKSMDPDTMYKSFSTLLAYYLLLFEIVSATCWKEGLWEQKRRVSESLGQFTKSLLGYHKWFLSPRLPGRGDDTLVKYVRVDLVRHECRRCGLQGWMLRHNVWLYAKGG